MYNSRRRAICPKCKIPNFYLKGSSSADILPIYITTIGEIIPKREGDTIQGYDTGTIYCLGCSWSGTVEAIIKKR